MTIESIYTAAKRAHAPAKSYLTKLSQRDDRPKYFVLVGDKWKIDIDSEAWKQYIFSRATKAQETEAETLPQREYSYPLENDTAPFDSQIVSEYSGLNFPPPSGDKKADLRAQKLYEEVREKKIKNEILYIKMQKESGNLFDKALVEYLYSSFMEKACVDFLRTAKKNEAIIDNLVKEGNTREIIRLIEREATATIRDIKKAQEETLKAWKEEEGLE